MNKLCLVFLGALLCVLHLASQVQALNSTVSPVNNTTVTFGSTMNYTTTAVTKSSGERTEVSVVFLPLALGFLHGWS